MAIFGVILERLICWFRPEWSDESLVSKVSGEMARSKDAGLEILRREIEESCSVKRSFPPELLENIWRLAERTVVAYRNGKKVLLMGNGGSAADAQHIAAELVGRFELQRKPLPAIALATDSSILTSVSNDFGFEESFARHVQALAVEGDILIAISTSGKSANVLRAVDVARQAGCYTAGLTGKTGGGLAARVDLLLTVPSEKTQRIQEAHGLIGHMYCGLVERAISEI
jgi:D-sedoheptulose 7-phosphate isomerase